MDGEFVVPVSRCLRIIWALDLILEEGKEQSRDEGVKSQSRNASAQLPSPAADAQPCLTATRLRSLNLQATSLARKVSSSQSKDFWVFNL